MARLRCPPASWWTSTGWCSWAARRTRGASPTPGSSRGWSPWPSPHQEISATHLEVRPGTGPDAGVAVLTDLGSTNGTWLVQPGRAAEDLRAGLAERLLPGAVVDLGDGVTIRVLGG